MGDSRFLLPAQVYDCVQCGKSCGGWRILVEPSVAARLQDHPIAAAARREGYKPLHVAADGWAHFGFRDGHCCFLEDDRGCAIHRREGWAAKPKTCRQYPFLLKETPDGYQVGLAFSCTAVQQNHGRHLTHQLEGLGALVEGASYPRIGFQPLPIGNGEMLSWESYREWEGALLARLGDSQDTAETLWAELALLLGREAHQGEELKARLLPLLGATTVGYLEALDSGARAAISAACLHGQPFFSPRRGQTILSRQGEALPQPELLRYLHHLIERKTFWQLPTLTSGLALLATLPALLAFYHSLLGSPLAAIELLEGELLVHCEDVALWQGWDELLRSLK